MATILPKDKRDMSFVERLQWIDRRWIYLMLVFAVALPAIWKVVFKKRMDLPVFMFPDTKGIYDTIEQAPRDKIVLVSADWGFASLGENGPQTITVCYHMLKKGVRFIFWSGDPAIPGYMQRECFDRYGRLFGRKEGVDYANLGQKVIPNRDLFAQALMDDIPGYFKEDRRGRKLADLPVMKGIKDFSNVWLFYTVGADPTYDSWIGIVQPKYKMKVGFGSTGVMVPQTYPFLESGQLCGMLSGMRGGAEYEAKMGIPGDATWGITRQSMAHLLVILFIILGNIGFFAAGGRKSQVSRLESVR
jgi:hypothetical protein